MGFFFSKFADNNNPKSIAHKFRYQRFIFFKSLLDTLPKPLKILDIGGTQAFWNMMDEIHAFNDIHITLLNLNLQGVSTPQFTNVIGDATALEYDNKSFDVIFSNSVIEHLFTWENHVKMAQEVQRVGKNYFVQTPNYYFPIEPHWVFPCFQYLPIKTRIALTQKFALGHIGKIPDRAKAENVVREIRLLTKKQMEKLFPTGKIWEEKIGFLCKSLVAYKFV